MQFLKFPKVKSDVAFERVLIYFAVLITNLSYLPFFVNTIGNKLAIVTWAILFILLFFYFLLHHKEIPYRFVFPTILFIGIIVFSSIQYLLISNSSFSIRAFRSIVIAFFILSVGVMSSSLFTAEKRIMTLMDVFSYSCLFMSLFVFFAYLIKSDVTGMEYGYQDGKNEISVLFYVASIYFIFRKKKNRIFVFLDILFFSFFILTVFFLRCRAVLIAYFIPVALSIFSKNKQYNLYRIPVLVTIGIATIIIFSIPQVRDYFFKSLISFGRDTATLDSFATGRFGELITGLNLLSNNPLFGVGRQKVEMFYGSIIVQYGFIFAIPFFIFSFIPLFPLLKYRFSKLSFSNSLCVIIGISFLILGIFEELMPIGPGVRTYILWFLVGINYFKNDNSFASSNNIDVVSYEVVNI